MAELLHQVTAAHPRWHQHPDLHLAALLVPLLQVDPVHGRPSPFQDAEHGGERLVGPKVDLQRAAFAPAADNPALHQAQRNEADEDDNTQNNLVLTVVLHHSLRDAHLVVSQPLNHYSLSRLYSQVVGADGLREARNAPDMAAAFRLPVG